MPSNPNFLNTNNLSDEEMEILNERAENASLRKLGREAYEVAMKKAQEQREAGQQVALQAEQQPEPVAPEQPPEQPAKQSPEQPAQQPEANEPQTELNGRSINELNVDQLLDLDISKLSRDELLYMEAKLDEEYNYLDSITSGNNPEQGNPEATEAEPGNVPVESEPGIPEPLVSGPEVSELGLPKIEDTPNDEAGKASEDYNTIIGGAPQPAIVTPNEVINEIPEPQEPVPVEEPEAPDEVASPEVTDSSERLTAEEAQEAYEKHKDKPGFKKIFRNILIGLGIAGILATSGAAFMNNANIDVNADSQPKSKAELRTEIEKQGIVDGYDEKGMWLSEHKTGPYAFADASEVAEVCNADECEMLKYAADNQVETFADYLANIPEELQPEGFKGLSILETVDKLESLSDEEYEAVQEHFNNVIDDAFTRRVTVDGKYDNAYMRLKDPSKPATHENMELVKCSTTENNLEVTQFYWNDENGNEIGDMIVKMSPVYDDNGTIVGYELCMQVLNEVDSPVYKAMKKIPANPNNPSEPGIRGKVVEDDEDEPTKPTKPTPTPTPDPDPTDPEPTDPEPTPEDNIQPKDAENLERIDNQILDDIADDVNTDEVKVTPTEKVSDEDKTDKPDSSDYEGVKAETTQNDTSKSAEPVQEKVSNDNNYSNDNGGSNSNNSAPKPVQSNDSGQSKADSSSTPVKEAPTSKADVADAMEDLEDN